jgi:hypothetical protein
MFKRDILLCLNIVVVYVFITNEYHYYTQMHVIYEPKLLKVTYMLLQVSPGYNYNKILRYKVKSTYVS